MEESARKDQVNVPSARHEGSSLRLTEKLMVDYALGSGRLIKPLVQDVQNVQVVQIDSDIFNGLNGWTFGTIGTRVMT
jgi:hypothetical protein